MNTEQLINALNIEAEEKQSIKNELENLRIILNPIKQDLENYKGSSSSQIDLESFHEKINNSINTYDKMYGLEDNSSNYLQYRDTAGTDEG
jgi:hypothetical protein